MAWHLVPPYKPLEKVYTDKERNEQYFSKKGSENNNRDPTLPPSKGGKFGGFGNPNCSRVFNNNNSRFWFK